MLSQKVLDALNEQINWELYSSYLYASMSAYFHSIKLKGAANWMKVQAMEELTHAGKLFDFIHERGGRVALNEVAAPPREWASPLAAFEEALAHERKVTSRINDLVDLALEERDHATHIFLQWFVSEQVEEEASVGDVVEDLKLVGDHPGRLFMIDRELGQRVMEPATAPKQ